MRIGESLSSIREMTMARNKVQFQKGLSEAAFQGSPLFRVGSRFALRACWLMHQRSVIASLCPTLWRWQSSVHSAAPRTRSRIRLSDPWLTVCRRAGRPSMTSPRGRAKCASLTAVHPDGFCSAMRIKTHPDTHLLATTHSKQRGPKKPLRGRRACVEL